MHTTLCSSCYTLFVNRFWSRRPHGVAINESLKIGYILEFKRLTDRDEGFIEVKDAEANEQHKSIFGAHKAATPEWEFDQINFVVGNRGSVVESDFYTKLKKLDIQEGKKDKIFADHVTQVCEAHYQVIVSLEQQVQGGMNHNPRRPPRVQKTDTFIAYYLFVLHSVTCLETCHFAACFTSL